MGIKADMPDFIDGGSGHNVTDVSGWGGKAASLALGTGIATVALGMGVAYGKKGANGLQSVLGVENDQAGSGATITVN